MSNRRHVQTASIEPVVKSVRCALDTRTSAEEGT